MQKIKRQITQISTFILLLLLGMMLLIFVREFRWELSDDFRPPHNAITLSPSDAELGFSSVRVNLVGSDPITAFYHPGAHGQVVIFLHGTGSDRSHLLPEARLLVRHGFGALLLDLPGHGESGGAVKWNEPEQRAVMRAIDWLYEQQKGRPPSIGLYGFSMGTMIAVRTAVMDQRILATILAGAFTSMEETFDREAGRFGLLTAWAWRCAAVYAGGARVFDDQPMELIGKLAPRPVLLISGSSDLSTPSYMTDMLYRAAAQPKFVWLALGAGHGEYYAAKPLEFEQEVISFYEAYLPKVP